MLPIFKLASHGKILNLKIHSFFCKFVAIHLSGLETTKLSCSRLELFCLLVLACLFFTLQGRMYFNLFCFDLFQQLKEMLSSVLFCSSPAIQI